MSRNKYEPEHLPPKLDDTPHSPPPNLTYFPEYVRTPDEMPSFRVSNFASDLFGIGVTRNDRTSLIVVFKWLSFTGSSTWDYPFFLLFLRERRRGSNTRPHLFTYSYHVCDAIMIERKQSENVTPTKCCYYAYDFLPFKLVFPPLSSLGLAETGSFLPMDALRTILLLQQLWLASYFSCLLRVPSSLPRSCSTLSRYHTWCVFYFFVSRVSCLISEVLRFRMSIIVRNSFLGGFYVVFSYQVRTLALDLPTLIISRRWFFSVSLSVTT